MACSTTALEAVSGASAMGSDAGLDNRSENLASSPSAPGRRPPPTLRVRIRVVGGEAGVALARAQGRALWAAATALGLTRPEVPDKEE